MFLSKNSTNSCIPPLYLFLYSFSFFAVLSTKIILKPLFKKASSLILFCKIDELNLVKENTFFDGKKFIKVPVLFVLPLTFRGDKALPSLNSTKYSFLSLNIPKINFSDKALTTETPTP